MSESFMRSTVMNALVRYIDVIYNDKIPNALDTQIMKFYEGELKRAQVAKQMLEEEGDIIFE